MGTYQGGVILVKDLKLQGSGKDQTILSRSGWDGIWVGNSAQVNLHNVQISGNRSIGIFIGETATVSLTNSAVSGNERAGLWVLKPATVRLANSTVSDNEGSGLAIDMGFVSRSRSTEVSYTSSQASHSKGSLAMSFALGSVTVALTNSTVSGNQEHGLLVKGTANVEVQDSTIKDNGAHPACQQKIQICNGIEVEEWAQVTIVRSTIQNNTDWGVAARLSRCGYQWDDFRGKVEFKGNNVIEGNNTSSNQNGMGNPGNHPWNRPTVPDGQVCLP